jgi:hypothetical protein
LIATSAFQNDLTRSGLRYDQAVMADDLPFYSPRLKPRPQRQATAGELVWSLRKNGRTLRCELRDHGPDGCEAQLLRDGEFYAGRRFDRREMALHYVHRRRSELERDGWAA